MSQFPWDLFPWDLFPCDLFPWDLFPWDLFPWDCPQFTSKVKIHVKAGKSDMADFYQQAQTPGKAKAEENKDASVPVTLRKSKEKIAEFQVVEEDGVYRIDTHRLHESEVEFMKKKEADAKERRKKRTAPPQTLRRSQRCIRLK